MLLTSGEGCGDPSLQPGDGHLQAGESKMQITNYNKWVLGVLMLSGLTAYASSRAATQIKILSSTEWSTTEAAQEGQSGCNWHDISAYCSSSTPETYVEKSMRVLDSNGRSMRIACTMFNRWSRCANLPVGQTFQAWEKNRSLIVRIPDSKGKQHDQKYEIVDMDDVK